MAQQPLFPDNIVTAITFFTEALRSGWTKLLC